MSEGPASPRVQQLCRPDLWELLTVSVVVWSLYLIACFCPVYIELGWSPDGLGSPSRSVVGWQLLLYGWLFLFLYLPFCIPWAANLLLLQGWIFYLRGRAHAAAVFGGLAAAVGLATFTMLRSEGQELLMGYYLWQTSLLVFAVASARHLLRTRSTVVECYYKATET